MMMTTTATTILRRCFFLFCLLEITATTTVVGAYYSQICPVVATVELVEEYNETTGVTEYRYNETDEELGSNQTAIFRKCHCPGAVIRDNDPFVCPYHTNLCAIPVDSNDSILCFEDDASIVLVRNIWPLVCLWYVFLFLLCFSYKGRHAITYCVQRCFPSTNTILVDRIMEHHQHIRQHYWNFWNTQGEDSASDECRELVLKTKPFQRPANQEEEEEDVDLEDDPTACCTICFVPMEDGDRIGDLTCGHVFHVECIKGWVQRKNTCPLCAVPLATPRKQQQQQQNTTTTTNNNNNEGEEEEQQQQEPEENV